MVVRAEAEAQDAATTRRAVLGAGLAVATSLALPAVNPSPAFANKPVSSDWELVSWVGPAWLTATLEETGSAKRPTGGLDLQVTLPVEQGVVLLDIGFTDDKHGTSGAESRGVCLGDVPCHAR